MHTEAHDLTIKFSALHRILIADDEPISVHLLTSVLGQAGFSKVPGTTDSVEVLQAGERDFVVKPFNAAISTSATNTR